jgi:hypothetical protein
MDVGCGAVRSELIDSRGAIRIYARQAFIIYKHI